MAVERVLVVGGGIGGLSSTIALRKAGVEVDVVELNPKWDVYGVGIIQPANAIRALDTLGLADEAVAQGFKMVGSRFFTKDGHLIAEIPAEPLLGPKFPPMNGITRPRLHTIFQEAVKASGASIRLGLTVDSIAQDENGVDVVFTDDSTGRYDVVIGADGLNSLVRRLVFEGAPAPEYTGQVVWRYNVPRPAELDWLHMFVGSNGKAGFVPLAPDLMYLLMIENVDPADVPVPAERLAETMRERLGEFGGPVAEIRDTYIVDDDAVVYRPVESLLLPSPWYRGRVAIIGDAAHATSPHVGQGAAMAIEDAIVLAEEITSDAPLDDALTRFMERRFERCHLIWKISRQIGQWEIDHTPPPEADFVGLTMQSIHATAAPI